MTVRSTWLLNPGQTRSDTRLSPVGTWTPTGPTTTRSGVVPGGNPLTLTITGMTATIDVGRAVVQGTTGQGAYGMVVTAPETVTIANGHASQTRYDTIWLVAYDKLYDTSGQMLAAVVYQQGTPGNGAPPTAPATGTAYLRLWDIQVPAGASAGSPPNWVGGGLLTDRRVYTAAAGGITPDGSTVGAFPGQYRDGGFLERYTGAAWESRLYLGTSGRVVIGGDAALYRGATGQLRTDGDLMVGGSILGPAWTPYTPTWSGLTAFGQSTSAGRWYRVGRMITVQASLTWGTGSTLGNGPINHSLPTPSANAGQAAPAAGYYVDPGAGAYRPLTSIITSGASSAGVLAPTGTQTLANPGLSYNWVSGAEMHTQLVYEAAS
ncbi:hypothetical protein [Kitasatospora sp. NPDC001132]